MAPYSCSEFTASPSLFLGSSFCRVGVCFEDECPMGLPFKRNLGLPSPAAVGLRPQRVSELSAPRGTLLRGRPGSDSTVLDAGQASGSLSPPFSLLSLGPGGRYLAILCLSFLLCDMEMITAPPSWDCLRWRQALWLREGLRGVPGAWSVRCES